ncbi:hypothetical protein [Kutzneria buriramensis]|uniref:Lipoprotein n=1 Tax=Kutzneria buriramensis TaxID=1045776 RepID=A0A3E0H692_9PSEU|nr:hypothetical protein [Kutzneria buriramensis]REH38190.1 hypothetical protein BCF44_114215 [Kutzneria buriramensis]
MGHRVALLCSTLTLLAGCAVLGGEPVSAEEMAATLQASLPTGSTARVAVAAAPDLIRYDDGDGAVEMRVSVRRLAAGQADQATACPPNWLKPYDRCTRRNLRGGAVVSVDQDHVQPLAQNGIEQWTVEFATPAGDFISLTEWNAPGPDADHPSRPHPPLSPDALQAVATSGWWLSLTARLTA